MGTRADFYVGRGVQAQWIGSVAWDGHPGNFIEILKATTEAEFRTAVEKELGSRDDASYPATGWPWPWNDSGLTDYSYAFDGGAVFHTEYPKAGDTKVWIKPDVKRDGDGYPVEIDSACVWPDMSRIKNVKMPGTKGSGVMVL